MSTRGAALATPAGGRAATPDRPPTDADLRLRLIRRVLAALLALYCALAIGQDVALFGDGSWLFLRTLLEPELQPLNPRFASDAITRLPLLTGIWMGLRDVDWLRAAYGLGLFGHYLLLLVVCSRAARRRPQLLFFPLSSVFLLSANMTYWPFSGSHVLVSVYWALLFVLLLPVPYSRAWNACAIALAGVASSSFESMLFLAPILVLAAEWRIRQPGMAAHDAGLRVVQGLCLLGLVTSVMGILDREPGHFTASAFSIRDGGGRVHGTLILSLATLGAAAMANTQRGRMWRAVALLVTFGWTGWIWAGLQYPQEIISVSLHRQIRTFNLWVTLLLTALFLLRWRPQALPWPDGAWLRAWRLLAVAGLMQVAWLLVTSVHWQNYLRLLATQVNGATGVVPYESTVLSADADSGRVLSRLTWGWTLPTLSILGSHDGVVRSIIANPAWYSGWVPFEPRDIPSLSALEAYGFRLNEFNSTVRTETIPTPDP